MEVNRLLELIHRKGNKILLPTRSASSVLLISKSVLIIINVFYPISFRKGIVFHDVGLSSKRHTQVHQIRD